MKSWQAVGEREAVRIDGGSVAPWWVYVLWAVGTILWVFGWKK